MKKKLRNCSVLVQNLVIYENGRFNFKVMRIEVILSITVFKIIVKV